MKTVQQTYKQQDVETNQYKEEMFQTIAELFEKIGTNDSEYSETQKVTDILEVLSTLLAFTIYNSCPTTETIRDASEATYFQIKQMALAYYYQEQQNHTTPTKTIHTSKVNYSTKPV